jgi:hypothetical protein
MRWFLVTLSRHVDDFEARIAIGPVDAGDFHQLLIFAGSSRSASCADQPVAL